MHLTAFPLHLCSLSHPLTYTHTVLVLSYNSLHYLAMRETMQTRSSAIRAESSLAYVGWQRCSLITGASYIWTNTHKKMRNTHLPAIMILTKWREKPKEGQEKRIENMTRSGKVQMKTNTERVIISLKIKSSRKTAPPPPRIWGLESCSLKKQW